MCIFQRTMFLALVGIVLLLGCSDSNPPMQHSDSTVNVSGDVYTTICWFGNPLVKANPMLGGLFFDETQEFALVTFVSDDGTASSVSTDNTSSFEISLEAGVYTMILESAFSYPRTADSLELRPGDTTLTLVLELDVLDSWLVNLEFYYPDPADSLGLATEWAIINRLNDSAVTSGESTLLNLSTLSNPSTYLHLIAQDYLLHSYYVPVRRSYPRCCEQYNVLPASDRLWEIVRNIGVPTDTGWVDRDSMPGHFGVRPVGSFPCPDE